MRGTIPVGFRPPLPGVPTLVQTFTVADPSAYARTVLIEALEREGVAVDARGGRARTRPAGSRRGGPIPRATRVARFVSPPYSEYAKLILKVSHNYGANLSLMYAGLSRARATRRRRSRPSGGAARRYGIAGGRLPLPDQRQRLARQPGDAVGADDAARGMSRRRTFEPYFASLPSLGVDGSLASVGRIPAQPLIAPAFGKVFAKTGTTIDDTGLKAQNFAGYFDGASGRRYAYLVCVNDVTSVRSIADVIKVFEDEGEISALLRAAG